ncbi:MAG: 50S ribosomal protein L24 [Micropruina sp.]|uniref:50S ribosomal protein L24 n=1 Tax=Micropruina sp. TaxID=2737536 RepID=UPI0039E5F934
MANSLHVKKGDRVKVIAGKDKGLVGDIIEVLPEQGRVVVEGVNVVKKHTPDRSAQGGKDKGGIITTEAPIDASNVQLVVKVDGSEVVTRVGYERREVTKRRPDGTEYSAHRSVRIARKTGKEI